MPVLGGFIKIIGTVLGVPRASGQGGQGEGKDFANTATPWLFPGSFWEFYFPCKPGLGAAGQALLTHLVLEL